MKGQKFIDASNLPTLAKAFAKVVESAFSANPNGEMTVCLIGEPGVGKSYISSKLSEAVLGDNTTAQVKSVPRENMHDLILWSVRESDTHQIIQYDEASPRFVDGDYNYFVTKQHALNPIPERSRPGITFAEHPDHATEEKSAMIVRVSFSPAQKMAVQQLRETMENSPAELHEKFRNDIAYVTLQGCLLEMEFQSTSFNYTPLMEFFESSQIGISPDSPALEPKSDTPDGPAP